MGLTSVKSHLDQEEARWYRSCSSKEHKLRASTEADRSVSTHTHKPSYIVGIAYCSLQIANNFPILYYEVLKR